MTTTDTGVLTYYLGSKRRMADVIADAAASLAPDGGNALDLFSGMGSASIALAGRFHVTAVDTQEYARTVCSALLGGYEPTETDTEAFFEHADEAKRTLLEAYRPLVDLEERAAESDGIEGDEELARIITTGCLLPEWDGHRAAEVQSAADMVASRRNLNASSPFDVIARYYGGTYFSYGQALEIDALLHAARRMPPLCRDRYMAAIVSAASQCGSTVGGQFAQPLKPLTKDGRVKKSAVASARRARKKDVTETTAQSLSTIAELSDGLLRGTAVKSECNDYLGGIEGKVDLIYADPPYSRYHYSRYYHVLETIARGDEPHISSNPATGRMSRGIYRDDRYQSPYSTRTGAAPAFRRLFRRVAEKTDNFLLSYSPYPEDRRSTPRMMTIESLTDLASSFFKQVDIIEVDGIKHSKLSKEEHRLAVSDISEVLILCSR